MNKIIPLQSLRGILCLIVAMVHYTPYPNFNLHNHYLAGISVIFFFILSGYILTSVYFSKTNNLHNFFLFIKKRFLRMYPLHFFFLILFLIIEFIKYYFNFYFNFQTNSPVFQNNNFYTFGTNLIFINSTNSYLSFNMPSWAASAEFISSIIFGIFFLLSRLKFIIVSSLIFMITWALFLIKDNGHIVYTGYFTLLSCLNCYFFGSLIYFVSQNNFFSKILKNNFLQIINLLLFLLLIKLKVNTSYIILCFSVILLKLIYLEKKNIIYDLICKKFLIFLGNISYSIYLSHFFIYWCITQIFRHILKIENIDSFQTGEISLFIYLLKFLLSLVITILVSNYTYRYIEESYRVKRN